MNINENIKNQQKYDKLYYHVPLNRPKEHKKCNVLVPKYNSDTIYYCISLFQD